MKALSTLHGRLRSLAALHGKIVEAARSCEAQRNVLLASASARAHARAAAWVATGMLALSSAPAHAAAADFQLLTDWLTAFAKFMSGPFGKGVLIISIIAAFVTWAFAPKDGIFGPVLRIVVSAIAILNAFGFISQFTTDAGSITLG